MPTMEIKVTSVNQSGTEIIVSLPFGDTSIYPKITITNPGGHTASAYITRGELRKLLEFI